MNNTFLLAGCPISMIIRLWLRLFLVLCYILGLAEKSTALISPNLSYRQVSPAGRLGLSSSSPTSTTTTTNNNNNSSTNEEKQWEEEEEEYEYIEYDRLTEKEFIGSEWLVGTCWDRNNQQIAETWARLIVDGKTGKNICIWGDNAQGTWSLDVASQFLSLSKENKFTGKEIWAATVNDYYYLQGTVRGWRFWSPASVLGQWQAKRLGVDPKEAGIAPWFEAVEDDDEEEEEEKAQ